VFVVGLGVGAATIALTDRSSSHVVVTRVLPGSRAERSGGPSAGERVNRRDHAKSSGERRKRSATGSLLAGSIVTPGAAASFASLTGQLKGAVGLAVAPLGRGPIDTFGSYQADHAWSTSKVPVLTTLLRDYENSGQVLSAQGHTDAALALEQSDNTAAEALFSALEQIHGGLGGASAAVQRTLERAGDHHTTINTAPNDQGFTTWGQSIWSTTGEILFYRALARGCLLGPHDTAYVLHLMRSVIPSERWGAGGAGYTSSVPLAFKGGWGPEAGGYLVRQTAIVGSGIRGYVMSMIAKPASGSFADGTAMITALASWARHHVEFDSRPAAGCSASI
jgi:Beta-lactamase enzyme family